MKTGLITLDSRDHGFDRLHGRNLPGRIGPEKLRAGPVGHVRGKVLARTGRRGWRAHVKGLLRQRPVRLAAMLRHPPAGVNGLRVIPGAGGSVIEFRSRRDGPKSRPRPSKLSYSMDLF